MMRKIWTIMLAFLILPSLAGASSMPSNIGIAAIVNDDVISTLDLDERVDLVLGTTGRAITPSNRNQVKRQALQLLIDEALKLQAAKRYNILVGADDVDGAIARIEQGRGKPPGSLESFIRAQGLSVDSFHEQVKGEVAWTKLLSQKIRREVILTDDEIYRAQQRMARGKKVKEVQIASIILPKNEMLSDEETLGIARDIRSQLINGADAQTLIKQYIDRIQLEFGPVTWVARDMLDPTIGQQIESLSVGQIAEPIPTPVGYQIIRLLDERTTSTVPDRDAEVAVKQIILKLNEQSIEREIEAKMDIAKSISKHPGTCLDQGIAGLRDFEGLNIEVNYIRTTLTNMSPDVRYLVTPLRVPQITEPFAAPDGIHLLMLCERIDLPVPLPDKEEVRQAVFQEKLELEAEKYMRTLRREAFIDVRS